MGKLTTYMALMTGTIALFYFAGLLPNEFVSTLLNTVLNPQSLQNFSLTQQVLLGIGAIAIVGGIFIAAGAALAGNLDLVASAGFIIWLLGISWDFLQIFTKVNDVSPVFAKLIFGPFFFLFVITIMEWWRGKD